MVTGTRAFTGDSTIAIAVKQLRESPKRPSEIVPSIPPSLEAVILKCLRKNAESRFQSVDELDSALSKPTAANNSSHSVVPAAIKVDAVVKSATAQWQAARPHLIQFGGDVHRQAQKLSLWAEIECKKLILKVVSVTPPVVRKGPLVRTVAAGSVAILGIGLFALVAGHSTKRDAAISQTSVSQPAPSAEIPASPAAVVPVADTSLAQSPVADLADRTNSTSLDGVAPTANTVAYNVPAPAAADMVSPADASPLTRRKPAPQVLAPSPVKMNSSAARNQPVASRPAIHASAAVVDTKLVAEPSLAAAPATLQPVAPAAVPSATAAKPDASTMTYLEVGSFKEPKWADDAVEKLNQMGFHAICVHKTMLWKLQSYRVQVGRTPHQAKCRKRRSA